jgi:CRP-like cAMP-binding protein
MIALKNYIENLVSLNQDEWEQIEACGETITLGKTDILINANSRFKKEVFVQKGVVRAFIVDNDGNEKTTAFFRKNEFISMNSFRSKNGLSLYTYQALNPTSLILINTDKFSILLNQLEKLKRLVKEVKGKETIRLSNRDECLLQVRAEEKYIKFRQFYPNIESDIAHHYIASYLGITPVSLSRIRKKLGISETINN